MICLLFHTTTTYLNRTESIDYQLTEMKLITVNDYTVKGTVPQEDYDEFRQWILEDPNFDPRENSVPIEFVKYLKSQFEGYEYQILQDKDEEEQ